jgi:hypothetical protein
MDLVDTSMLFAPVLQIGNIINLHKFQVAAESPQTSVAHEVGISTKARAHPMSRAR